MRPSKPEKTPNIYAQFIKFMNPEQINPSLEICWKIYDAHYSMYIYEYLQPTVALIRRYDKMSI